MKVLAALLALAVTQATAPQTANPLKDVGDVLVGKWTGEGIYAADYPGIGKKGEKFTSTMTCRWTAGQAALACEGGENSKSTGITLYWWDAGSKQVRYAGANSGGNSDQGTIAKQGAKLVWASVGAFADGRRVEYKGETLLQDNGNTRIEVGATILGGARNEFRDTYKRVTK